MMYVNDNQGHGIGLEEMKARQREQMSESMIGKPE